ncbi:mitochondrial ribosomal protein L49 [Calliopsis andreniformis]|uniref:mitochondrial ribosomal protein L49 n=1 Tax=Calliopsis andreniformis TaxID=337506 RepID=UPI003FCEBC89
MAALRLFTRSKLSAAVIRSLDRSETLNRLAPIASQIQKRWGSYTSSPVYKDPSSYTDYEVTQDPKEWEYVERLLKPMVIPIPPLENKDLPSGWKPPVAKPREFPYYVMRTRHYMIPVYLIISYRGIRRLTQIRKIQGDIWTLEAELTKYLKQETGRKIGVRVNELIGEIVYRGDYVSLVKKWFIDKGF